VAQLSLHQVVGIQRQQVRGLVDVRGIQRMRKVYDEARKDLRDELDDLVRRGRGQTFTAHHLRVVLVQVGDAIRQVEDGLRGNLREVGEVAAEVAPRHLIDAIESGERMYRGVTPVVQAAQAAVFQGLRPRVSPSLLNKFDVSVRTYGAPVIGNIRDQLSISIAKAAPVEETIDRVAGTDGIFQKARWRADRIVRTEGSYAYGVQKQQSMEQLRPAVPQLLKRLVTTFDGRTGADSVDLNGQTVPVNEPFLWVVKNSRGVPTGKIVRYMQPPNRPNDREVVIPWLSGWSDAGLDQPGPVQPSTRGLP
jgi:hypothetical protein